MNPSEGSRPPPKSAKRWLALGLVLAGLVVSLLVVRALTSSRGTLWVERPMTARQFLKEEGIALEELESFKVFSKVRNEMWKELWYRIRDPDNWFDAQKIKAGSYLEVEFEPRSHATAPDFPLLPGDMLVWTRYGSTHPKSLLYDADDHRFFHYYADFSQPIVFLGSLPEGLLACNGKVVSHFPPYEQIEALYTHQWDGSMDVTARLKVSDPKTWVRDAAEIAVNEGKWEYTKQNNELEARFADDHNRDLAILGDEVSGTVTLKYDFD